MRARALALARRAGAGVVRLPADWRSLVASQPPPGFRAADPADPAYRFATLDAAVRSVASAHMTPLLVLFDAPVFAEAPDRWHYAFSGSWAPSAAAFEAFAAAVARRYDGAFPDPLRPGRTLPRVSLFQAWNEPNLARYLEPQWVARRGRWSAFSPLLYRRLLNAAYTGIKSVQPHATVASAGVAPNGDPAGVGRMTPVSFLRALLCLEGPRRRCGAPAHLDALAFHPLSVGNPDLPAPLAPELAISDAAKVTALLRAAQARGTVLPRGPKPVWVTELNWESAPAAQRGVPPALQGRWISRALHRLWVAGVQLVDWQLLIDPYPALRRADPTGGYTLVSRPAGLYSAGAGGVPARARPKPFLRGFALPFDPLRVDRGHVRVWALLDRRGREAQLQRRMRDGRWRTAARLRAGEGGVLNALVTLAGAAELRIESRRLASAPVPLPAVRTLR